MNLGLRGKVALVTGGSQGIGRSVALQLAAEGAKVALTYRAVRARGDEVVRQIERSGGRAMSLPLDLGSLDSVRSAVERTGEQLGGVDILVNNAVRRAPWVPARAPRFEDAPVEAWRGVLHDNLDGAFAAVQAVVPGMRQRRWGRIVNISSGAALDGDAGMGAYAMAKAGLHGLTAVLARELGPLGILTNVVVPGITVTEGNLARMPADVRERRGQAYAIGRLLGPDEVAPAIVYLCSAANTAVTGEVIRASGGRPYPT